MLFQSQVFSSYSNQQRFSAEALAVFALMPDAIPKKLKRFMNTFINSQVAAGNWSKIISFVPYRAMNTEPNSIKDWKGVISDTTYTSGTFTLHQGIRTTGSLGSFVDTKFIPSAVAAYAQDDAGIGVWINDNAQTSAGSAFGCVDSGNRQVLMQQNLASNFTRYRINSSNDSTQAETAFTDYALYCAERTAAGATRMLKDTVQLGSSTAASTGESTREIYLGSRNNVGSADLPLAAQFGLFFVYNAVGFDHTAFYNAWINLLASVESGTDNDSIFVPLVITAGQSNSVGRGEVNRFLALTEYNTAIRPGVQIYYKPSRTTTTDDGNFQPYTLGVNSVEPAFESSYNCAGSEVSLCDMIYQRTGVTVYLIKAGEGGTGLYQEIGVNDWNVASTNKSYFFLTQSYFDACMRKLEIIYPNREIRPFFAWHQGEHDQDTQPHIDEYPTNLANMMSAWRAYNSILNNAVFLICKLRFNINSNEDQINAHLENFCDNVDSNSHFIVTSTIYPRKMDLPSGIKSTYPPTDVDDQHNSYEFHVESGILMFNKLVELGVV